jgi:hypothetical protein
MVEMILSLCLQMNEATRIDNMVLESQLSYVIEGYGINDAYDFCERATKTKRKKKESKK